MKRYFLSLIIIFLAMPSVILAETLQPKVQPNTHIKIVKKTLPSDANIESKISFIENKMRTIQAELEALNREINNLKQDLDGMNEMSEMTSMRLQMTMDRRSKFISTLNNIMKKMSDTSDTIVQKMQ